MKYIVIARSEETWYLQKPSSVLKHWTGAIKQALLFDTKEQAQKEKQNCENMYKGLNYKFFIEVSPEKPFDVYEAYNRALGVI